MFITVVLVLPDLIALCKIVLWLESFKLEAELSSSGIFKALVIPFLQSMAQCYLLN